MPKIQKKKKKIEQCTKIFIYRDLNKKVMISTRLIVVKASHVGPTVS